MHGCARYSRNESAGLGVQEVLDGEEWVVEYHSWAGPSHYHLYSAFHGWAIAVYGAFAAYGLVVAIAASVKSLNGVIEQLPAVRA